MAKKVLKTIAMATTAGAAFGLGSIFALANRPRNSKGQAESQAEVEKLLARLAALEGKAEVPQEVTEAVGSLSSRVEQTERLTAELEAEVRAAVDTGIGERIEAIREELVARQDEAMANFATAMDSKVSERLGEVEATLAEQFTALESVAASNAETGRNVERLVTTMERLMARIQEQSKPVAELPPPPVSDSGKLDLPFRTKVILEPEESKPRKPMARMM